MGHLAWFEQSIDAPLRHEKLAVKGADIEIISLGNKDNPGVLLIHGAWAHANWWVPIMPLLAKEYCVMALSLGGMGSSDWRDSYSLDLYTEEVLAASKRLINPLIVAHSFGGYAGGMAAAKLKAAVRGLIIIDTFFRFRSPRPISFPQKKRQSTYDSKEQILSRFRLMPRQSVLNQQIVDYIAEHSIKEVTSGQWQWKFDPKMFDHFQAMIHYPSILEIFGEIKCPAALIYGEHSTVTDRERTLKLAGYFNPVPPVIEMPQAYHHIMIDQPIALASTINALSAVMEA